MDNRLEDTYEGGPVGASYDDRQLNLVLLNCAT